MPRFAGSRGGAGWLALPDRVNRGVGAEAFTAISVRGPHAAMERTAIVGIHDVAGRASTAAVIAGVIVAAEEIKRRIEQARFLQANENGVGPQIGSQPPHGELDIGFAWIFIDIGNPHHRPGASAAFEYAQDVSRLTYLPARKRVQKRKDSKIVCLLGGWGWLLHQFLRHGL